MRQLTCKQNKMFAALVQRKKKKKALLILKDTLR